MLEAISALEEQRLVLGDNVVNAAQSSMRKQLAELESARQPEQQRKLVTVLFADLVGFTAKAEGMDPEDVQDVQQALFKAVTPAITNQGGLVEKYIGDAILAVFGLPQARENDPERGVRAGLGIQAALEELNEDLESRLGLRLRMRVGINTGLVVARMKGEDDFVVTGDTVNLAARLESAAPPGGVLISHDTYRHVRGLVDVQVLDPIRLKGKSEPIQVYIVDRVRAFPVITWVVEGVQTRMIGRDHELQQVKDTLYTALEDRELQMVTIVGDAGIGKSRLGYEFSNWLDSERMDLWVMEGRLTDQMRQLPYALVRNFISYHFNIHPRDSAGEARSNLKTGMTTLLGVNGEEKGHFIGKLLGFEFSESPYLKGIQEDTRQIRARAFHYLVELLTAMAEKKPVLIFLEDIHWADDGSLDLIEHLMQNCQNLPLMILCMARPTLFERRPLWGEGQPFHTRLNLRPLSRRNSRLLVTDILRQIPQLPEKLRDLIIDNAEGSPFYISELIKMLVENRVILKGEPYWQVASDRLSRLENVPPTLIGVLQARLDRLSTIERDTLQKAAVVGRIFWAEAVTCLNGRESEPQSTYNLEEENIPETLESLRRRELIFARSYSAFARTNEYTFKHALLHEVTYESVLKQFRPKYHEQVAEWLIEQSGDRVTEYMSLIAEHFSRAGNHAAATEWHMRAGQQAKGTFANQEALDHFNKALKSAQNLVSEETRKQRLSIRLALGELLIATSQYEPAHEQLLLAHKLGVEIDDLVAQANACRWLARLHELRGEYKESFKWADCGLKGFERQDSIEEADIRTTKGLIHFRQGNFNKALVETQVALQIAYKLSSTNSLARATNLMGVIAIRRGNLDNARECFRKGLKFYGKVGDLQGQALSHNGLANVYFSSGSWNQADHHYRMARENFNQLGDVYYCALADNNLGGIARNQGRLDEAVGFYLEALRSFEQIGVSGDVLGTVHMNLGATFIRRREIDQAIHHLNESQRHFEKVQARDFLPELHRHLAQAALLNGHTQEAETQARESLQLARKMKMLGEEGISSRVFGEVAFAQNRLGEAEVAITASISLLEKVEDAYELALSHRDLAKIYIAKGNYKKASSILRRNIAVFKLLDAEMDLKTALELQKQLA